MNRPALEALRDAMRQTIGTPVSPFAVCVLLDALLAPDESPASASIPGLRSEVVTHEATTSAGISWAPAGVGADLARSGRRAGPCPCVVEGLTHDGVVITESCLTMPVPHTTWMCKRTIADALVTSGIALSIPFERAQADMWHRMALEQHLAGLANWSA